MVKVECERCGCEHYFSKRVLLGFGNKFKCLKCGKENVDVLKVKK